ncbi:hypothetical protein OC835_003988 [Tilletia horrida]|nr:hypothetical protein OC835_003988 [Tilletia horrida]
MAAAASDPDAGAEAVAVARALVGGAGTETDGPAPSLRLLDYDLAAHAPTVPVLERICAAAEAGSSPPAPTPNPILRSRLYKALLRAADCGDSDVLAWLFDPSAPAWRHLFAHHQPSPPPPGLKPDLSGCRTDSELGTASSSSSANEQPSSLRGTGPLVLAASSGHLEAVRMLVLQAGCDINERDEAGWTALMWAVSASNLPLVSFLLSNGADVETQSLRGATVEDLLVTGAGTSTGALHDGADKDAGRAGPAGVLAVASDRELIADMIYEQMRTARKNRARASSALKAPLPYAGTPSRQANTPYSVSRSASPTKQLAATPLRSPYNFSPEGSPAQMLSPTMGGRDDSTSETPSNPASAPRTPPPPAALAHLRGSSGPFATGALGTSPAGSQTSTPGSLSKRKLLGRGEREQLAEAELRARELVEGRKRALLDMAWLLEVDYPTLMGEGVTLDRIGDGATMIAAAASASSSKSQARASMLSPLPARARGHKARPATDGLPSGCGALEVGSDPLSAIFSFTTIPPDQMLVFSMSELDALLDLFITNARPYRAPWARRAMPANALYLCARFAVSSGDAELMEELVLSAINRIQEAIHLHHARMNHLVFWLFNATLLLHYFQRDESLAQLDIVVGDYQPLLRDMVDEIFVFVIREAERRVDKILDAAMLEHQSVPGLGDDIRFEGEWAGLNNTLRSLAGSVKSSMAGTGDGAGGLPPAPGSLGGQSDPKGGRRPLSQIFSRWESPGAQGASSTPASSVPSHFQGGSPGNSSTLGSSPGKATASPLRSSMDPGAGRDSLAANVASARAGQTLSAQEALAKPTPRTVTMLLSATLHMMQLYEINPCVIVQALSQVFYWIGCELFNRMLGLGLTAGASSSSRNKRYLCRSRAMHIRLNISALEDWARSNALPLSIVNAHITPLRELVSWLQCQSSLREFDALIMTVQSLRALNPAQMRKAVKDYRYEVGEGRMSEECLQYLEQLQKDWERRSRDLEESARQTEERRLARARLERQAERQQLSPSERYRDRELDGAKDRQGTASPLLVPGQAQRASKHHRSGTATQNGDTPDSRSPSPSENSFDGFPDISTSKSVESGITAINEDDLSPAEKIAHRAQMAIDSLFEPGRGMNDYVPPWTAAGAAPGPNGEVVAPCGPSGPAEMVIGETLHSREMLPFAMPSKPEALVVTPGDAFGFGRGHFTGTGSPALKNVRAAAGSFVPPAAQEAGNSSVTDTGTDGRSVRRGSEIDGEGGGGGADSASVTSGTSSSALTNASSRSSCSSLYPMGKGFAAGGAWEPVPILPDGFLEQVDRYLERMSLATLNAVSAYPGGPGAERSATQPSHQHQQQQQQQRQASDSGRTPTDTEPAGPPWLLPQAGTPDGHESPMLDSALASPNLGATSESATSTERGGFHEEQQQQQQHEEQHEAEGRETHQHHERKQSGLSALPTRLQVTQDRLMHRLAEVKSENSSCEDLVTPIGRPVTIRTASGRQLL